MKSYVLYFALFFVYGIVNGAATTDEAKSDIEAVVRVLIAQNSDIITENKNLKIRIENLERERATDRLQIEGLTHRIIKLEEKYATGKSGDNLKSHTITHEYNSILDGYNSTMDDYTSTMDDYATSLDNEVTTADNADEYLDSNSDSSVASKQRGVISSSTLPFTGQLSKRAAESEVAFHVYLSGNRCYSNHEVFKFDMEAVDIGGGFNIHDGIYDVPATGLYVFTWTVAAPHGTWFVAELIVNGVVKGAVMTDSDTSGSGTGIHPATGVVLANANAGDHVYIQFVKGTNCNVESDGGVRTTFSGWLLA